MIHSSCSPLPEVLLPLPPVHWFCSFRRAFAGAVIGVNTPTRKKFRTPIQDADRTHAVTLLPQPNSSTPQFCNNLQGSASNSKRGEPMAERLKYAKAFPEGIHAL